MRIQAAHRCDGKLVELQATSVSFLHEPGATHPG